MESAELQVYKYHLVALHIGLEDTFDFGTKSFHCINLHDKQKNELNFMFFSLFLRELHTCTRQRRRDVKKS